VFFFFPELKGRSIESMDMLFANSAFSMRKHAYPTEADKVLRQDEEGIFAKNSSMIERSLEKNTEVTHHEDTSKR
jgi:hypothetical protein